MEIGYQVLDSGNFQKLEQVGPYRLVRPSPQAVWKPVLGSKIWDNWDGRYIRLPGGNGKWDLKNQALKQPWTISYEGQNFVIKATEFGHLGLFPEHLLFLSRLHSILKSQQKEKVDILNLFAYTGAATLLCRQLGAHVVHVDASKTSVSWAKENLILNRMDHSGVRWIVDDVRKFVTREVNRNSTYDGIILDPPSFGRGTKGELWKIEEHLVDLLDTVNKLLKEDFEFVCLSSHSAGYSPLALANLTQVFVKENYEVTFGELTIPEASGRSVPCGAYALVTKATNVTNAAKATR